MEARDVKTAALTEVNGHIVDVAGESVSPGEEWDFFCECGKPDCQTHVSLTVASYVELRDEGRAILADGHRLSRAEHARRQAQQLREDATALRAQARQQTNRANKNRAC